MKLHTFTGFSNGGMDGAVGDAHRDYDQWLSDNRYTVTINDKVQTTATIATGDGDYRQEYWFTITIIYREVQK